MKIAVFQFASSADIGENEKKICGAIAHAAEEKVRLLVFHECAACGYPPIETPDIDKIDYAALDALLTKICILAKKHDMFIALGIIRKENSTRYNSMRLISPKGTSVGDYDKRALWGWDLNHFDKGSSLGIFDIDGIKVGFRICFEVRFPEYFRELFTKKVRLCFVSFSDVAEKPSPLRYDIIKAHLLTRAVENVMTVVSVNSISDYQTAPTAVFDINGKTVSEAPLNKEHLLIYDYEPPTLGYGARGRIENSVIAMSK